MMREQAATHNVEAPIAEGKSEPIRDHSAMPMAQMREKTVEVRNLQRDVLLRKLGRRRARDFAESCSYFQYREVLLPSVSCNPLNQVARRTDAAEPAIHAA